MKYCSLLLFVLITLQQCKPVVQETENQTAQIIEDSIVPIDKDVLSGIGLDKVTLKDTPERDFFQKRIFRGEEISVYVVSSQSWKVDFEKFWFDEFICMFNGSAQVKHEDGREKSIYSRDMVFAPKGFPGTWEVQAGDNYSYELSVITNKRNEELIKPSVDFPIVLNPEDLSGNQISIQENEIYEKSLVKGSELEFKLIAEKPQSRKILQKSRESLVHVLSGKLILEDTTGKEFQFTSGDYFAMKSNFQGLWTSEGHGLVKYLTIAKS